MTSETATFHPRLRLLHDTGRPRMHMINTVGRRKFSAEVKPPIYGEDAGVFSDIFYQRHSDRSTRVGVQQFSAMIVLTLEDWSMKESVGDDPHFEDVCLWGLQVYPPDNDLIRALDTPAENGSIMDQLKGMISMMQKVPLMLGSAIILRFGHRGAEYPYMEVEIVFDFGAEKIRAEVDMEISEYEAHERKPHIRAWRLAQGMFGAKAPKRPTPIGRVQNRYKVQKVVPENSISWLRKAQRCVFFNLRVNIELIYD